MSAATDNLELEVILILEFRVNNIFDWLKKCHKMSQIFVFVLSELNMRKSFAEKHKSTDYNMVTYMAEMVFNMKPEALNWVDEFEKIIGKVLPGTYLTSALLFCWF